MRIRHIVHASAGLLPGGLPGRILAGAAFAAALIGSPALAREAGADYAHGDHAPGPDNRPEWHAEMRGESPQMNGEAREAWLADCRHSLSRRDNGVGGAVIGGLIGGFAGNRIAGRGDRVVGTVAGAAVGAAAGMAIDKAEDRGRNRDACEAYLDDYYAYYGSYYGNRQGGYGTAWAQPAPGYGYPGYGHAAYGYMPVASGCCQPVTAQPECTETVEYEYVDAPARRAIPRRAPRAKIAPDKRIRLK